MSSLSRRATRLLLACTFAFAPATLAAQAPASAVDPVRDARVTGIPSIGLLTRVRFTDGDTTIQLTGSRPIGGNGTVIGRLVSYGNGLVVLDLPRSFQYTIPVSSLSSIEQRVGAGPCRRTLGGRALCALATVGGGMRVGRVAGEQIGKSVVGPGVSPRPYAMRGAIVGTIIGLAMFRTIGRDEWMTLPMATGPN